MAQGRRHSGGVRRDPLTLLAPILMIAAVALVGAGGGVEQLRSLSQVATGPAATELETLADADSAFAVSLLAGNPLRGELAAISAERSVSDDANGDEGGSGAASTGGSNADAAALGDGSIGEVAAPAPTPAPSPGSDAGPSAGDGSGGVGTVVEDAAGRVDDTVDNAGDIVDRTKDTVSDKVDRAAGRTGSALDDVRGEVRAGVERTRDVPAVP